MDDYKCVLILYLSGYIQTIANLEPSWGWQLRQNAEVTMIIPSVDGGVKGCMSPRNFVRCAHQHSSTHHYAHHLKNNAVEKKINCQSSPWFPQQKLKIRTASQCNTIYEGWVSSTSFTILYLRTCFLVMWERQMYIWQKHVFFVSHYFGAIIAIQAIPHFEDIWSTPAQVATCNYVSHVAKHLWLIYQNQKLSRESPLDPQTLAPKNLCSPCPEAPGGRAQPHAEQRLWSVPLCPWEKDDRTQRISTPDGERIPSWDFRENLEIWMEFLDGLELQKRTISARGW